MKPSMKKGLALVAGIYFFFMAAAPLPAFSQEATAPNSDNLENQVLQPETPVSDLEKNTNANPGSQGTAQPFSIAGFNFTGGISAGIFYTSHAGRDTSDSQWLLSNALFEISRQDKTAPVGFTAAVGETSTPSILSAPGNTNTLDIEYASLDLIPVKNLSVDVGLLQPNAGYESSYTYNNKNAFLGALASQQPYNAYGARIGYDLGGIDVCAGYYKGRLNSDEYVYDGNTPNESWELGLSTTILESKVNLYYYHLESLRSLTGMVIEHSIAHVDLALNVDYWKWDSRIAAPNGDDSSIGAAFYITPRFGRFSLPVRLEYIHQGQSGIYLENAPEIYAATVSPTYHFTDRVYIRADAGFVKADKGFTDENGTLKNDRAVLATEVGYTF